MEELYFKNTQIWAILVHDMNIQEIRDLVIFLTCVRTLNLLSEKSVIYFEISGSGSCKFSNTEVICFKSKQYYNLFANAFAFLLPYVSLENLRMNMRI